MNGSLIISSVTKKSNYNIDIKYTFNNVYTINTFIVNVTSKILYPVFVIFDKVYDGTTNLKVKSNKLYDVLNNDKVFINSYNASFLSSNVSNTSQINITNIILDGPDSNNYIIDSNLTMSGNIYYGSYIPNIIQVNRKTSGSSLAPILSNIINTSTYVIQNPINGIKIDDFGVISWDNTLDINTYNINILVYNNQISFIMNFSLIVTTNLYSLPITIDLPIINNFNLEYNTYSLRYNSISGQTYAIDTPIPSVIAKFNIRAYTNNLLNHDLGSYYPFIFNLPNANPYTKLILYELNDDNTINQNYQYGLTYISNNNWVTNIRYFSDFYVQDANTITNTPPTFIFDALFIIF
jgi:hypothetical protein